MNQKKLKDLKVGEFQTQKIDMGDGEIKEVKVKKIGDKKNPVPASEMLKGSQAAAETSKTDK